MKLASAKLSKGFSLVEVLVVTAIITMISVFLISSFNRFKPELDQSINILISDLRIAQTKALAGNKYKSEYTCGWGVHKVSATSYSIYAVIDNDATPGVTCTTLNKNFNIGAPNIYKVQNTLVFVDQNVEIYEGDNGGFPFKDIFFQPPNPTVYFDNVSTFVSKTIQLCSKKLPRTCKSLTIYDNGKIEAN